MYENYSLEDDIREFDRIYEGWENESLEDKKIITHEEMEKRIIEIINEIYDEDV